MIILSLNSYDNSGGNELTYEVYYTRNQVEL